MGAQQNGDDDDDDEREHFRQVCQSYQQYATFHSARQRGVDDRVRRTLDLDDSGTIDSDGTNARTWPDAFYHCAAVHTRKNIFHSTARLLYPRRRAQGGDACTWL